MRTIFPITQHGMQFDSLSIKNKEKLNEEFKNTPINGNIVRVAIVWFESLDMLDRAALSVNNQLFWFF